MNITNLILNLNKILQFFIFWITALESIIQKLQADHDKTRTTLHFNYSVMSKRDLLKSVQVMKNSSISSVKTITYNVAAKSFMTSQLTMHVISSIRTHMSDRVLMSKSMIILTCDMKNLNLSYASAKFSECQICMIRDEYFDCD